MKEERKITDRMQEMAALPAIHADDLSMAYREKPVLRDIDFDIPQGGMTAIIGPNGAGKSTLLKGLLELEPLISGHVLFYGEKLDEVRRKIAYVPQKSSVNWNFPTTVYDVIMMGRYPHLGLVRRPGKKDREPVEKALAGMELEELRDRQIEELSGGQKQRVFLARAMAQEAELYLLDEPLQGVDVKSEKLLVRKLKSLAAEGRTVVAVHHDLSTAEAYFDRVLLLNRRVLAFGSAHEVLTAENLRRAYRSEELSYV